MTADELKRLSSVELRRRLTQRCVDLNEAFRLVERRDTQTGERKILALVNRGRAD